jgi:excisionase family DNA binding protein
MTQPLAAVATLVTAKEVGVMLNGVPVSTIHAWARSGYLPCVELGKHRRFHRDDIAEFVDVRRQQSPRPRPPRP